MSEFRAPTKVILTPTQLEYFQTSQTHNDVLTYIGVLNEAVVSVKLSGECSQSDGVTAILTVLDTVENTAQNIPPVENAASRFGNPAFRTFYDRMALTLHESLPIPAEAREEVAAYFIESWGNRTRIDYGSGMELNFLCWLMCLERLGALQASDHTALVIRVFWRYLRIMRTLQSTYWLEPAGSHGVWGLDDYHFLPFLFGSAQLRGHKYIRPKAIHDAEVVEEYSKEYIYFACIQFINSIKSASLRWHSPMLDDISAVKTWDKVNSGMVKMYTAEVLGKLPVIQHFLFGSILEYGGPLAPAGEPDGHGHGPGHKHEGWGDCCGIPVPSAFAAANQERKSASAVVHGLQIPLQLDTQYPHKLISAELDAFVKNELTRWNSSGLAVAVVRQDLTSPEPKWHIEFGSYGTAQADGAPVTPDTQFAIASNSKLFLAISVGLLLNNASIAKERGEQLRWDTKIHAVLPEWELMDETASKGTTIQDMLSHRTGLPRHDYSGMPRKGGVSEMISTMKYLRPSAELREQYQYNNLMFETLSHLPPTLLNQSFESYIAEHIFMPLGMATSTYSVAEAEAGGNLAHGYQWHMQDYLYGRNGTLRPTVPYFQRPGEENIWAGAAGILASARDLSLWVATLLNKGRHPHTNETIIPKQVVDHVATGVSVAAGKAAYPELSPKVYGCGQDIYSYRGHVIIEHGGSNPGFKTQVARFPNDNLAIVALSNDENGGHIMESVKWRIADQAFGLEKIDWAKRYGDEFLERIAKNQKVTPRPADPRKPSASWNAMQGTFGHGAYGNISPCFVASRGTGSTPACTEVLKDSVPRRILAASPPNASVPTFIVPFKRTFSTYLRFMHFDANVFNVSYVWSNADVRRKEGFALGTGEDDGDVIVGLDDRYVVEWVDGDANKGVADGWAFSGDFWGKAGEVRPLEGETARERAEVWFGRV
ncbi:F-box domain-containing protein [Mycena kentingensis (nom. inval.)]|nr:F-box domain-containing protein [Mycena kentingensis (nom. inval.)]